MTKTSINKGAIIALAITLTSAINRNDDAEIIAAYEAYYNNCEALLDSIASWDDAFGDTVMETDVYYDYYETNLLIQSLKQ